ncbi:urea carboxylase-associated family protein [uncultured Ruegeria sp.]|uniref:urea carboxylase-associated family protein n=1 Tax=uncultured Ruegeria sp. TaxID=259304 RepID=UPI0026275A88|nr:urea carboxylase-associated family protein [uncultured Ruegeria sp.]
MTAFDPGKPDGANQSLEIGLPNGGSPELGRRYEIPARCGRAVKVQRGQSLKVINPVGFQVCDFWIFNTEDLNEYSSMEHLHTSLLSVMPKVGDGIVSNLRRPLMTITEDTSPGVHDTVIAACDHARYRQLGVEEYHDNCVDNLRQALLAIGHRAPAIPAPFNLWMNVPIQPDGRTAFAPPVSKPGDYMTFKADMDVIAVMSACPQDVTPVNGEGTTPDRLEFQVDAA